MFKTTDPNIIKLVYLDIIDKVKDQPTYHLLLNPTEIEIMVRVLGQDWWEVVLKQTKNDLEDKFFDTVKGARDTRFLYR